jgi:hypothetical protein
MSTDDLVPFLVPEPSPGMRYGQGKVLAWDQATFSNRILWRDVVLEDLPVVAGTTGLTVVPGDDVVLLGADAGGDHGVTQWWVQGPLVEPGTTAAERQVEFLRGSLAKSIVDDLVEALLISPAGQTLAAFAFASRVRAAEVASSVGINSGTYVTGTGGPAVTDVPVSSSGLALVGIQAQISIIASPSQTNTAYISYRVTGATSRSATDANAKRTDIGDTDAAAITNVTDQSMSWSIQSGLNEGLHDFEAMYRNNFAGSFINRRIIVIAL